MTLAMVPPSNLESSRDDHRGWAVVEILPDGSLGPAEFVTAAGPEEAARGARPVPVPRRAVHDSAVLDARLGLLQAAGGHLGEASRSFTRGVHRSPGGAGRRDCLGQLALVEAYQGALQHAKAHADLALALPGTDDDPGVRHARLALAWIHAERDEHGEAALLLDRVPLAPDRQPEPWLDTARLLLEAKLLAATRPESAVRLLAEATGTQQRPPVDTAGAGSGVEWPSAALRIARADALLTLGEPHRALAVLTPVPQPAVVDASVTIAAACLDIGDVRGAEAVLASVLEALDRAPLALQLRAWLLEARIVEERGKQERARALVDRALRAASAEGLRAPVRREWPWLRLVVDRDSGLGRSHRDLLLGFRHSMPQAPPVLERPTATIGCSDELLGASLTERETEVLELLAQMCSTDEIAAALFVSANTVKTHLKGIFGKLCVNRRVDAVRRGRQLGLC
jgi:LuxR family maltose regulon positive regulatory protein